MSSVSFSEDLQINTMLDSFDVFYRKKELSLEIFAVFFLCTRSCIELERGFAGYVNARDDNGVNLNTLLLG